jgi:hypothetical protein
MTDSTPAAARRHLGAAPAGIHPVPDRPPVARHRLGGPEGNARVTGLTAGILLVLLAAEGCTLLQVHALVTPHVVIGMVLVPFVLLKVGATGWRIVRYYLAPGPYRDRGAPPLPLRLLGPVVVLLTLVVFASGIALLLVPHSLRATMFFAHKASFVLWFGAMTLHVLGHLLDTGRLAPADLLSRTRRQVRGAGARLWAQAGCLVAGILLAVVTAPAIGPWLVAGGVGSGG